MLALGPLTVAGPPVLVAVTVAVNHDQLDQALVSFACVRRRSMCTNEDGQPRSQTALAFARPWRADLENVRDYLTRDRSGLGRARGRLRPVHTPGYV
jgi:hypothetical protein